MNWMARVMIALAVTIFAAPALAQEPRERPRVVVLTDIGNEPDDAQSLVRFLLYANQFEVEGLVATTSRHLGDETGAWRIRDTLAAYARVRDNLELHEPGYPTAEALLALTTEGQPGYGLAATGPGRDTAGSHLIIRAADRDDPRPLWVLVWGGPNTLAQALRTLRETRTPEEIARLIARLRVYAISDQDDTGPWIRREFPDLFYIASPGIHPGGGYHRSTWVGISGDRFHGRFTGPDFTIVDNPWLDEHIRAVGPLGAQYPHTEFIMEGDTPSFLHLIDNGLGDPEQPGWGGWGGRYELYQPRTRPWFHEPETRPLWADSEDEVLGVDGFWHTSNQATIWRWRQAYQNDFAARMAWTVALYADANHPPVAVLAGPSRVTARPGETIELSALGSHDPDGDALSYSWFAYGEAGTYVLSQGRTGQPVSIENADQPVSRLTIPESRMTPDGGELHIILVVTDQGTPALTRYRRVIVEVRP